MRTNHIADGLLTTLLLAVAVSSPAQTVADSLLFEESHALDTAGVNELRLNIDNLDFFRDNEYKGHLTKGYTLPGFRLRPTVSYQPLSRLRLDGGVYMLHYWGANKYPNLNYGGLPVWMGNQTQRGFHLVPFLRVHYAPSASFHLVLGSLYGQCSHRLAEPLYNPEMALSADPETGFQILWSTPWLNLDTWINWESFIYRGDDHQESFTYGLSSRFLPNRPSSPLHVYIPLQIVAQHHGGETNTEAEERSVKTWVNAAVGCGVTFNLANSLLHSVNIELLAAAYRQVAGEELPMDNGVGLHAKVSAQIWRVSLKAAYWHARDFITVLGNPLFGGIGIDEDGYTISRQRMAYATATYGQEIGQGFSLGFHASVYNNFGADAYSVEEGHYREKSAVSIAAGVYMRYNTSFLLKKLRR